LIITGLSRFGKKKMGELLGVKEDRGNCGEKKVKAGKHIGVS